MSELIVPAGNRKVKGRKQTTFRDAQRMAVKLISPSGEIEIISKIEQITLEGEFIVVPLGMWAATVGQALNAAPAPKTAKGKKN